MKRVARAVLSLVLQMGAVKAAVDIDAGGYTQDFAGMTTNLPEHWLASQSGVDTTPVANAGTAATGGLYSYGSAASSERALGALASGGATPILYGLTFFNNSGSNVTTLSVAYTGEQWRNSGNGGVHTTAFAYAISASVVTSLTQLVAWSRVPELDFHAPVTGGGAAALDGNVASNRSVISATITLTPPLSVGAWAVLFWRDLDESGNDHGLAVDDLTVQWGGFAPPTAPPPVERLLGFWHCNTTNASSILDFGTTANQSDYRCDQGTISNAVINVWEGLVGNNDAENSSFGKFGGSARNWPVEAGVSVEGGSLGVSGIVNNDHWFELRFDRAVTNGVLSYATSGSGTGATSHTARVSTDGGTNWSLVGSQPANRTESWSTTTFDLAAVFAASVGEGRNRIRIMLDGATGASGRNRFDNLQLNGAFPYALLALSRAPLGAGVVEGGGYREVGEAVVIQAQATYPGWRFTRWSDGSREATRVLVVPLTGLSLTAHFATEGGLLIVR